MIGGLDKEGRRGFFGMLLAAKPTCLVQVFDGLDLG